MSDTQTAPIGAFARYLARIRNVSPEDADRLERENRLWLDVGCSTCGADVGEWCVKKRYVPHEGASHLARISRHIDVLCASLKNLKKTYGGSSPWERPL
jgi:hypothetical protein